METVRILLSFLIPLLVIFYLIHKKADPTFFLLVAALLSGLISGQPLSSLMGTISEGFGSIMIMCGLIVVFGVVFSEFLSASGGVECLARCLMKQSSAQGSIYAIYALGYVISIPINFTPAAALMMPLIKRLSAVSGKPVQAYACALAGLQKKWLFSRMSMWYRVNWSLRPWLWVHCVSCGVRNGPKNTNRRQ